MELPVTEPSPPIQTSPTAAALASLINATGRPVPSRKILPSGMLPHPKLTARTTSSPFTGPGMPTPIATIGSGDEASFSLMLEIISSGMWEPASARFVGTDQRSIMVPVSSTMANFTDMPPTSMPNTRFMVATPLRIAVQTRATVSSIQMHCMHESRTVDSIQFVNG